MAEVAALIGLFQSAKAAQDVLSSLIGLRVSAEISGKIAEANKHLIELQGQIMAAQRENAALVARIRELEEEAVRSKRQHGDLEDYELTQVGPGSFVYAMRPNINRGGPLHWLCPNCFANSHKSQLQHDPDFSVIAEEFFCPRCKSNVSAAKGKFPGRGHQ